MVKIIAMIKRKPGITPDEFARYWYEEHAPLGFEVLPEDIEIRGYIQNHTMRKDEDLEPLFDGVVEPYLDDEAALERWFSWFISEGAQRMRDDEQNFMDSSSVKMLVCRQQMVVAPQYRDA
jgi:uncharacterized protein (TIGR02118 family)